MAKRGQVTTMTFERTGKQTVMIVVNLVLVAGLAAWSLWQGVSAGRNGMLILGVGLALWAAFIAIGLVRRRTLGALTRDGLTLRHVTHDKHVTWDRMQWADIPEGGNGAIIGYREDDGQRTRMAAFSQRALGPEAVDAIRQAIRTQRPDLPHGPPHEQGKTGK